MVRPRTDKFELNTIALFAKSIYQAILAEQSEVPLEARRHELQSQCGDRLFRELHAWMVPGARHRRSAPSHSPSTCRITYQAIRIAASEWFQYTLQRGIRTSEFHIRGRNLVDTWAVDKMRQKNTGREIRRQLQTIAALQLREHGASYERIGNSLRPPVCKQRVFRIVRQGLRELVGPNFLPG